MLGILPYAPFRGISNITSPSWRPVENVPAGSGLSPNPSIWKQLQRLIHFYNGQSIGLWRLTQFAGDTSAALFLSVSSSVSDEVSTSGYLMQWWHSSPFITTIRVFLPIQILLTCVRCVFFKIIDQFRQLSLIEIWENHKSTFVHVFFVVKSTRRAVVVSYVNILNCFGVIFGLIIGNYFQKWIFKNEILKYFIPKNCHLYWRFRFKDVSEFEIIEKIHFGWFTSQYHLIAKILWLTLLFRI